jgi:integrase
MSLPAGVNTVLAYMQDNLERSKSVQNNVAISASISAFHEKAGLVSPCLNKQVRNFVMGVKKTKSKPVVRKAAMTKEILKQILRHCISTDLYSSAPTQPLSLWREAMFELCAFLGMARLDDLLHVKIADITFSESHMTIFCPTRKNDSLNRGHSLLFKITNEVFCPKRVFKLYLERLSSDTTRYAGPLLPFLKKEEIIAQKVATYPQMRNTQYSVLAALGLDPKLYGCHSSRRGSCKASKAAGRTEEQVRIAGGWSENSSTPQIYDDNHDHAAKFAVSESLAL